MSNVILQQSSIVKCDTEFRISGSKSISQRALIINFLIGFKGDVFSISDSQDTVLLNSCLLSEKSMLNVGNSGTTLRFLIAVCALKRMDVTIIGDAYLFDRPINPLINYLNLLGANISHSSDKILIKNGNLMGGELSVSLEQTSQFVSALLLIAPYLSGGLKLNLSSQVSSYSYVLMTLKMLDDCGIHFDIIDNSIVVYENPYKIPYTMIESDWTSVSYLFLSFLFSKSQSITIASFSKNSIQPDSNLVDFFSVCGISFSIMKNKIILKKNTSIILPKKITWNFNNNPDLSLTILIACFGLGIELNAIGLHTLIYKESNRIVSMKNELLKFNCVLDYRKDVLYLKQAKTIQKDKLIVIDTYNDHRIALAFSPLVLLGYKLQINNPKVITKSYPNFFNDLIKFGVLIQK